MRRAKLTETPKTFMFFVEVPKDAPEVAPILRLVRDLATTISFGVDDAKVASSMQKSWLDLEKRSVVIKDKLDPYELSR